jgi:hypothetical protein
MMDYTVFLGALINKFSSWEQFEDNLVHINTFGSPFSPGGKHW